MRLDISLQKMGLTYSRQKAKELIKQGHISVNGSICFKPSYLIKDGDDIKIIGETLKYVGRGGLKLEKIIDICRVDLNNKICMDIGASTGGFTDCMLQRGALLVYSVDVGFGQLSEKLRCDERVVNMEKTDIRKVDESDVRPRPQFISVDVSFISLKHVLSCAFRLLDEGGTVAALIKPQFEAGRENIGKNGIVKSRNIHIDVINEIIALISENGFGVIGLCYSPITGANGNIEYLICMKKGEDNKKIYDVKKIVSEAFLNFNVKK